VAIGLTVITLATLPHTPSPLLSPSGHSPSEDSISTPGSTGCSQLFYDWHKKAAGQSHTSTRADEFTSDDLLFPDDDDDNVLPLFSAASPLLPNIVKMPSTVPPIDIASSRPSSSSPRQSNLTTQLLQPHQVQHRNMPAPEEIPQRGRQESVAMLSTTPFGARNIPMGAGQRRESYQMGGMGGSLVQGGGSWGSFRMVCPQASFPP
jgi:transcription factor SFP1